MGINLHCSKGIGCAPPPPLPPGMRDSISRSRTGFPSCKEAWSIFPLEGNRDCGKVQTMRQKEVCSTEFSHFLHTLAL